MATLTITMSRRADGGAVLHCRRPDGSETWHRHRGPQAAFFPVHDLTHLAVERSLGFRRGFFGLIAEGWAIEETTGNGARGPLPAEAIEVEQIVGLFDAERSSLARWSAAEFNDQARAAALERGQDPPRSLTDADLERVRRGARELVRAWSAIPPGDSLRLSVDDPERERHHDAAPWTIDPPTQEHRP